MLAQHHTGGIMVTLETHYQFQKKHEHAKHYEYRSGKDWALETSVNFRVGIKSYVMFLPLLSRSSHGNPAIANADCYHLAGIC